MYYSNDSLLQQAVTAELSWEPSVASAHIGVAAKDGVVTLTGLMSALLTPGHETRPRRLASLFWQAHGFSRGSMTLCPAAGRPVLGINVAPPRGWPGAGHLRRGRGATGGDPADGDEVSAAQRRCPCDVRSMEGLRVTGAALLRRHRHPTPCSHAKRAAEASCRVIRLSAVVIHEYLAIAAVAEEGSAE